jgi:ankyrin repeat protein
MGHFDIVKLLIDNNFNIDEEAMGHTTGFHLACQNGCVDIVKLLLSEYVNITIKNGYGYTGFQLACVCNHKSIIYLLADKFNRVCVACNKAAKTKCPYCDMRYCSRDCQLSDWNKHNKLCIKKKKNN